MPTRYRFLPMLLSNANSCLWCLLLLHLFMLVGCQKNFDIRVKNNEPLLVVEAYINNEMRGYNYVILSRSLDYLSTDFENTPVANAAVTITEGTRQGNGYVWDSTTTVHMQPANLPGLPAELTNIYFDPRLLFDTASALLGKPGKSYLLQISEGGRQYTSITTLLQPVLLDSLTAGFGYTDVDDDSLYKLRITNHYQDPDTLNNTQLIYYRYSENRNSFGWGAFLGSRAISLGTDELTNGQYIHLTGPRGFVPGDTVTYHMASVTRDVYRFWESFDDARNNGGPFSTPVKLATNIAGTNVTGCFSGLSLSSKTIIVR